jgi:hypothetical protein
MNAKQRMNGRILSHGLDLKRALFADPYSGPGPVTLCKALHRLEVKATRVTTAYCNGENTEADLDKMEKSVMTSLIGIFGKEKVMETGMFINQDPRGYALKISDEWMKGYESKGGRLHKDWGGYGILAPEFDGRP